MRIISKWHDYYDGVMKTGMDREVVYVREAKDVVLEDPLKIGFTTRSTTSYSDGRTSGSYTVSTMFLGYCGLIYKLYLVTGDLGRFAFYDYEEFKDFMLKYKLGSSYDFAERRWWPGRYQEFKDHDTTAMVELFHKFQTPLFLLNHERSYRTREKTTITLGPCLKDCGFQKIKDSYTTYQDIFQFVAGVLNHPESTMVKISDKDKIAKHGFDKFSFRKMPAKKR